MSSWNKSDTKGFILGVIASVLGIVVYDILKSKYNLFNYDKDNNKNG
jgi:hypothetical protein